MGELALAILDIDADGLFGGLHVVIRNPAEVGRFAAENKIRRSARQLPARSVSKSSCKVPV